MTLPSPGPSSQGGEHGARVLGEGALGSGQGRSTGGPPCRRPSLGTCSWSSRMAVLDFHSGLTVTPPSSAPAFLSFKTFLETVPYEGTATVPLSNMAFTWDVVFFPPARCLQAGTSAPALRRQPCSPWDVAGLWAKLTLEASWQNPQGRDRTPTVVRTT